MIATSESYALQLQLQKLRSDVHVELGLIEAARHRALAETPGEADSVHARFNAEIEVLLAWHDYHDSRLLSSISSCIAKKHRPLPKGECMPRSKSLRNSLESLILTDEQDPIASLMRLILELCLASCAAALGGQLVGDMKVVTDLKSLIQARLAGVSLKTPKITSLL